MDSITPSIDLAGRVLVLRSTPADRVSQNGFVWPESGPVVCSDWSPERKCGNGLHGLLWGVGSASLMCLQLDAIFQVVAVYPSLIVDLGDKVKFPRGEVVFSGDRFAAAALVGKHAPVGTVVPFSTATAGYRGTATAGDSGTATAGDRGTATAGDRGTATAGDRGTATAGDSGTATAGYRGTATAGDRGTATAGYRGTATAGEEGYIAIKRWNGKRYKWSFAEVDGETILPNVPYRLDDDGKFIPVSQ